MIKLGFKVILFVVAVSIIWFFDIGLIVRHLLDGNEFSMAVVWGIIIGVAYLLLLAWRLFIASPTSWFRHPATILLIIVAMIFTVPIYFMVATTYRW